MKVDTFYYECDICGRKTDDRFLPELWRYYAYKVSWRSGSHSWFIDKEFLSCFKCAGSRSVFKKMLDAMKDEKDEK